MSVKFGDSNIGAEIGTPSLNASISKPSINVNFNAPSLGASGGNTILRELVNPQFFIGTVTTLEPDQDVYCYLTGTKDAPVLNFGIPKGYKGDTGQTGATGQAATIAVGTVTTGQPTDPASVTNSGTPSAAVFNFVIPKGDKGDTGAAGADGQDGADGNDGVSPEVTISTITGGHTVTITDADHPTGQSFNVMDGTTPTVPVTDVTVNGSSVVTSGVAQVVVPEPAPSDGATPSSDTKYGSVGTSTQYARKDHRHTSNFPTTGTPADLGTAANGTSAAYAHADHVHNYPEVVHVGASAPSDSNIQVWLDTDEAGMSAVSSVNAKTGTVVLDADDVGAMSKWVLLWENASPTSDFVSQTIQVDVSAYDYIAIEHKVYPNLEQFRTDFGRVGSMIGLVHPASGAGYFSTASNQEGVRGADTSTTTQITFSNGMASASGGQFAVYNNRCIPTRIYGIKGVNNT